MAVGFRSGLAHLDPAPGPHGKPADVGVRSPHVDLHTSLSADACTLYFSSTRTGNFDLWIGEL